MKLTDWEELVKEDRLTPDFEINGAVFFVEGLKDSCLEAYEYIMDCVNGSIDGSEVGEMVICGDIYKVQHQIELECKIQLNEYIRYALECIEDKELQE